MRVCRRSGTPLRAIITTQQPRHIQWKRLQSCMASPLTPTTERPLHRRPYETTTSTRSPVPLPRQRLHQGQTNCVGERSTTLLSRTMVRVNYSCTNQHIRLVLLQLVGSVGAVDEVVEAGALLVIVSSLRAIERKTREGRHQNCELPGVQTRHLSPYLTACLELCSSTCCSSRVPLATRTMISRKAPPPSVGSAESYVSTLTRTDFRPSKAIGSVASARSADGTWHTFRSVEPRTIGPSI